MADRIAGWGYTVLAPNILYRSGTAEETSPTGDLRAPGAREAFFEQVGPRIAALTPDGMRSDIPAYLAVLREHSVGEEVGVVGYCMGARLAVRAASLDPGDRRGRRLPRRRPGHRRPRQPPPGAVQRARRVRLRPRRQRPRHAARGRRDARAGARRRRAHRDERDLPRLAARLLDERHLDVPRARRRAVASRSCRPCSTAPCEA